MAHSYYLRVRHFSKLLQQSELMAETLCVVNLLGVVARDGESELAALRVFTDRVLTEWCM